MRLFLFLFLVEPLLALGPEGFLELKEKYLKDIDSRLIMTTKARHCVAQAKGPEDLDFCRAQFQMRVENKIEGPSEGSLHERAPSNIYDD